MTNEQRSFADVAKTIEDIRVAMMTTADDDGGLASRPMAVMRVDDDGAIWFLTHDGTHKLEHLRRVNLAFADRGDADYLSVRGAGEVVRDRATIESLWSPMAKPWFPDGPQDPRLVALCVRAEDVEYWDATSSRMARLAEMGRAAITGTRANLGEHGHVRPRH
jgi:general stress protein 26